jgi:hypothetical protein
VQHRSGPLQLAAVDERRTELHERFDRRWARRRCEVDGAAEQVRSCPDVPAGVHAVPGSLQALGGAARE